MNGKNLKAVLEHPLFNGLLAAVIGGVVSLLVSYLMIAPSQDRQMRLDSEASFSTSTNEILGLGLQLVTDLNVNRSLGDTKVAIANASGSQAVSADSLTDVFGDAIRSDATAYQGALGNFVKATNEVQGPGDIKEWLVSYDGLVNAQKALKAKIHLVIR